jgi:LysR family hydrogen peroxide-inducible transcriptional activator
LRIKPFVKPVPARTIGAVWRKSTTRGPAIEAIAQSIRAAMQEESKR